MSRRQTEVLVLVVTYNSAAVVGRLLEALPGALRGVPGVTIVVVDNASDDDSAGLAEGSPVEPLVIRCAENLGYAAGINVGLKAVSPTRALLVLNADARPKDGFLIALLTVLESPEGPPTGIVAPRVVDHRGNLKFSLRRDPTLGRALGEAIVGGHRAARFPSLGEQIRDPKFYTDQRRADWATGAALLVSAECLRMVGPWDESFFLYSEETDYAMRAREAGWVLRYACNAVVEHPGGQMSKSPFLWSIVAVNRVRLYQRRHSRVAGAAYRMVVTLNEALRAPFGKPTHRAALKALLRNRRPGPEPGTHDQGLPWTDRRDQRAT